MPYGMPKEINSPSAEKFMEACVSKVTGQKGKGGQPIDKSGAVAICKANWQKRHEKNKEAGIQEPIEFILDDSIAEEMMNGNPDKEKFMNECQRKMMKAGKDQMTAEDMCENIWEKTEQDSSKAEYIVRNILSKK